MVCLDLKAVIRQKKLNPNKQRTRKMKIGIRERPADPVLNAGNSRAFRSVVGEVRIGAKKWKIGATKGVNPSLTLTVFLSSLFFFRSPCSPFPRGHKPAESLEQAMLSVLLRFCP